MEIGVPDNVDVDVSIPRPVLARELCDENGDHELLGREPAVEELLAATGFEEGEAFGHEQVEIGRNPGARQGDAQHRRVVHSSCAYPRSPMQLARAALR